MDKCPLCDTESETMFEHKNRGIFTYRCPKCGCYAISEELQINIRNQYAEKIKAAMLAAEWRIQKEPPKETYINFILTDGISGALEGIPQIKFKDFLSLFPKSPTEILNRSFLNIAKPLKHPGESVQISQGDYLKCFSKDKEELLWVLRQMIKLGWISSISALPAEITVEAKGWQKYEELTRPAVGSEKQAFVAMWFDDEMDDVYNNGIKKAVEAGKKIKCIRLDLVEHNEKICDQIIAEIRKSRYLIADFTGNRGGVYFEAGFALGLGIPVIWLVREDDLKNIHFDTEHYNHIVYKDSNDLYTKLLNRIRATIHED